MKEKIAKKYYLSSTGFDTLEECIGKLDQWRHLGTLNESTMIIEAKSVSKVVQRIEYDVKKVK